MVKLKGEKTRDWLQESNQMYCAFFVQMDKYFLIFLNSNKIWLRFQKRHC